MIFNLIFLQQVFYGEWLNTEGHEKVNVRPFHIVSFPEVLVGEAAFVDINSIPEAGFFKNQAFHATGVSGFQQDGGQDITNSYGCCACDAGSDIRDTIVNDTMLHESRMVVVGYFGGGEAAALIDTDIHDNRSLFHFTDNFFTDEHGGTSIF